MDDLKDPAESLKQLTAFIRISLKQDSEEALPDDGLVAAGWSVKAGTQVKKKGQKASNASCPNNSVNDSFIQEAAKPSAESDSPVPALLHWTA